MKVNTGDILFGEYLDSDWVSRRYYFKIVSIGNGISVRELDGWYDSTIQETVAPIDRFSKDSPVMQIRFGKPDTWEIFLDGGLSLSLNLYEGCVYVENPNGRYTVSYTNMENSKVAI